MVLHLDDGVRYPLFGHLVSDDTLDTSVNLRETAEGLKPCGITDRPRSFADAATD